MLVLSRKLGEKIVIGGNIVVTVVKVDRNQVRLGFDAPQDVSILREEVLLGRPELASVQRDFGDE
jgi:carbon storage regulator